MVPHFCMRQFNNKLGFSYAVSNWSSNVTFCILSLFLSWKNGTDLKNYSNSPSWSTDSKNVKTIFVGSGVQAQHLLKELKVHEKKTKNVRKKRLLKFAQLQIEPEPLGLQKWFLHFWNLRSKTVNLSTFGGLYDH